MVGVVVTTEARSGQTQPLGVQSSQMFITGVTERGDTSAPIKCRNMNDVVGFTGGRVPYGLLYDQLMTYFSEGGTRAYINRVVGSGAAKGTITIQDNATTPVDTLKVDAADVGSWSERINVTVLPGVDADTYRVQVTMDGQVVHDISNLSSPADVVTKFSGSNYVQFTNLGSTSTAPENNPAPGTYTLTAGTDDRATITDNEYIEAMNRSAPDLGDGAVVVPGRSGATMVDAIKQHCADNNRIALLAGGKDDTVETLMGTARGINSEFMGLFAPWLMVSDNAGGLRAISPEGYVAAVRARAHEQVGAWRAPAGSIAASDYVQDVYVPYSAEQIDQLEVSRVNAIRSVGSGVRLYGWRSLSADEENWAYLKDRDLINRLVIQSEAELEDYVFSPIDPKGQTLAAIQGELIGMVDPIREAGGLYERMTEEGEEIDPGYIVVVDQTNNTKETLARNEIHAELAVRISPVGSLIRLTITKVGILSGL